jgi:alanine racemase
MRVDMGVLANNMRTFMRRMQGSCRVMAVVKADAYGHGAVVCSTCFLENGASALAVATVDEAIYLRDAGICAPVLVLGGATAAGARECVARDVALALCDEGTLFAMQREAALREKIARAHLKIDTGMIRVGLRSEREIFAILDALKRAPNVRIEAAFTHFAAPDADTEFTREQNARFLRAAGILRGAGYAPVLHAAASAAALLDPAFRYDCVRPGIALYGEEVGHLCPGIEPAQTLVAKPVRIEEINAGETVGYGRAFTARRKSRIMTLPVGYGDGYPRALSEKAQVLVKGRRAPIAGRVCMDMLMADITDIEGVSMDDEVVLMGKQGGERIAPSELALLAGTIPYEIILGFHARVPRVVIGQKP